MVSTTLLFFFPPLSLFLKGRYYEDMCAYREIRLMALENCGKMGLPRRLFRGRWGIVKGKGVGEI